jgi:hypothetical protein
VTVREAKIDRAVLRVIAQQFIKQGYNGVQRVNLAAVRDWFEEGAPLNAWWFAFVSTVQAEYRRLV